MNKLEILKSNLPEVEINTNEEPENDNVKERFDGIKYTFEYEHRKNLKKWFYFIDIDFSIYHHSFEIIQPNSFEFGASVHGDNTEGQLFVEYEPDSKNSNNIIRDFSSAAIIHRKLNNDEIKNIEIEEAYYIDLCHRLGSLQEIYPKFFIVTGPFFHGPWKIIEVDIYNYKLIDSNSEMLEEKTSWMKAFERLGISPLKRKMKKYLKTRTQIIKKENPFFQKISTKAIFDRKNGSRILTKLEDPEEIKISAAYYLDFCRKLGYLQEETPRCFFVIGREKGPWKMFEIDINDGSIGKKINIPNIDYWPAVFIELGLFELKENMIKNLLDRNVNKIII